MPLALLVALALTPPPWPQRQPPLLQPPEPARFVAQAMQSPWWENYDQKDRYLCPDRRWLVLERNDSQASLISGGSQLILFREASDAPGLHYRNDQTQLILKGDELTVERLPLKLTCVRTDQV